jgi:hypothetical protein
VPCVDQFALTDSIATASQACQTNEKKRKLKEKSVQTDPTPDSLPIERRYPRNSKSFEKIMKGGCPKDNRAVSLEPSLYNWRINWNSDLKRESIGYKNGNNKKSQSKPLMLVNEDESESIDNY